MSAVDGVSGAMNVSKSNLFPILPSTIRDSRYQCFVRVRVSPTIIPSGANLVSAPSYQSQGWTISSHPEGKRYAHSQPEAQAGITIVTEAPITDPGVLEQLNAWLAIIYNMVTEENVHPLETSHLFLEIRQDSGTCNYYFADHGLRTIFWLHTTDTISVRLPPSYSSSHLQYSLEENYWIHVELFPETASQYSEIALNELQATLLHARADALTSETPTFPYTANQCQDFIQLLQCSRAHASSPHVTTYVARLWATVANHRFFIHFGEDHCRMSSDQAILEVLNNKESLVLAIMSKTLLFGLPDRHRAQFERLWVDQLAYTAAWRKHVSGTVEDLKQMMSWVFALLIANILMIQISSFLALTNSSLLLCILGLVITSVLLQEQQRLVDTTATTAAVYLDDRNTKNYGFQPIAIVHCLPQALFVWALLLFLIQGFWIALKDLSLTSLLSALLPTVAVLVIACVGIMIWQALHPRQKTFEDAMLPPPISSLTHAGEQKVPPTAEVMV
ncbi:hypothetical protein EDB86DRAFT_2370277 [Lactarius hatsudake]|nr:hypothetical protein EDB86DRAFT_2370277 [Lactarius hatsudake]